MATGNFKSMEKFPLIVSRDYQMKVCPHCSIGMGDDVEKCEECGYDMTTVESEYDECLMDEIVSSMEKVADALNEKQPFYEVKVESGYYSGVQFYVEDKYYDMENWTNDEAQNEFGMCRSEMLRKYRVAENTICRELRKAKKELSLDELSIMARFSNGETWYSKVA